MNRRDFLKVLEPAQALAQPELQAPRYAMLIDLRRCLGCQACSVACAMENRLPQGYFRTLVADYEILDQGKPRKALLPRLCNHCEKPPCVAACPTKATFQRADGVVLVDNSICVGCGYCLLNCPYGARYLSPLLKAADKCTFCAHRLQAGMLPACVETCPGKARIFGNQRDPQSLISQRLAEYPTKVLHPEHGTEPRVYYIGLDSRLVGKINGMARPDRYLFTPEHGA